MILYFGNVLSLIVIKEVKNNKNLRRCGDSDQRYVIAFRKDAAPIPYGYACYFNKTFKLVNHCNPPEKNRLCKFFTIPPRPQQKHYNRLCERSATIRGAKNAVIVTARSVSDAAVHRVVPYLHEIATPLKGFAIVR